MDKRGSSVVLRCEASPKAFGEKHEYQAETVAEIPTEGLKGLGTKIIDDEE